MTDRPGLGASIAARLAEQKAAAEERGRPEREARAAGLKRDAALYGTPGWDVLPTARRHLVALHVLQAQRQGADDAA